MKRTLLLPLFFTASVATPATETTRFMDEERACITKSIDREIGEKGKKERMEATVDVGCTGKISIVVTQIREELPPDWLRTEIVATMTDESALFRYFGVETGRMEPWDERGQIITEIAPKTERGGNALWWCALPFAIFSKMAECASQVRDTLADRNRFLPKE